MKRRDFLKLIGIAPAVPSVLKGRVYSAPEILRRRREKMQEEACKMLADGIYPALFI